MTIAAVIINHNGSRYLKACLASVMGQTCPPREVLVVDNGSTDDSVTLVRECFPAVRLVPMTRNLGYAGAANVAVRETRSPYLLLLNPDVVLMPTFLEALLDFARARGEAGSFTGKLLRFPAGNQCPVIDSTGHLLCRSRWVLNRGEWEADTGQYSAVTEVFGVSGAAPLYRREMLEDVQVDGEVFPESFFLYLEDADLDWRAQLRGWKAFYVPSAVAYHERGYKGGGWMRDRSLLRHSLKNRYLLLLRNDTVRDVAADLAPILAMECARLAYFLVTAPGALRGYVDAVRLLPGVLAARRTIHRRVTAPRQHMRRWVRQRPSAAPIKARLRALLAHAGRA